ncbi:MAG: cell division protein FtsQ/DivIB, partial [Pseudonocardiaceae bacterium]
RVTRGRGRRVLVAVLAIAGVGAAAWVLLAGPLLGTHRVEVAGTVALPAEQVRAAAGVPIGTPLLWLDTSAIESRVERLRRVADAEVSSSVTGTVGIKVTERAAVAVLPAADGPHLIDATGTDFATVPFPPPGLPELRVPLGDPAASAAIRVIGALPAPLRGQLRVVTADSPADVVLLLGDGREVRWGTPARSVRKAAVLVPLLTRPGQVYDVSSPALPTVS